MNNDLVKNFRFSGWTATDLPRPTDYDIELTQTWDRAEDATGGPGLFYFRPSILFTMWGSGHSHIPDEFGVGPEYYFTIDSG